MQNLRKGIFRRQSSMEGAGLWFGDAKGVGFLTKVTGRLNGDAHIDLLGDSLFLSVHFHSMSSDWIFQQDNATSCLVREWSEEEEIDMAGTISKPIENLWDYVGKKQNPTSMDSVWTAVKTAWEGVPVERLKTLYESLPRRCEAIIKRPH